MVNTSLGISKLPRTAVAPRAPVSPAAEPAPPKEWTVLVYAASDNNLMVPIFYNLRDMERVGSNDQMNLVTECSYGGSVGVKRYYLTKCGGHSPDLLSPVTQELGKTNMASPGALADFVQWGMKEYPAKHYMLVINSHGGGWQGACEDDSHRSWMKLSSIASALATARQASGQKLDILGFDACLMGDTEVAHELQPAADFMVGSQASEGSAGWSYSSILNSDMLMDLQTTLRDRLKMDPKELARDLVAKAQANQWDTPTMAAYDMSKIPALVASTDAFSQAVAASSGSAGQFASLAAQSQSFRYQADLGDFAERIANSDIPDERLKQAAAEVKQAIAKAVLAEQHSESYAGAKGISIELGTPGEGNLGGNYADLKFARETHWQDVQAVIASGQVRPQR